MNKPEATRPDGARNKPGEPGMDEILASIRKIIADEPGLPGSTPDRRAVNPLIEPAPRPGASETPGALGEERLLPPADRFSQALRPDSALPSSSITTTPAAAPAARGLDADLEDLLEGEPNASSSSPSASAAKSDDADRASPAADGSSSATADKAPKRSSWIPASLFASPAETPATTTEGTKADDLFARDLSSAAEDPMDAIAAALASTSPPTDETSAPSKDAATASTDTIDFATAFPAARAEPKTPEEERNAEGALQVLTTGPIDVPLTPAEATRHARSIAEAAESRAASVATGGAQPASGGIRPAHLTDFPFDPVVPAAKPPAAGNGTRPSQTAAVLSAVDRETQMAAASALGALAAGLAASSKGGRAPQTAGATPAGASGGPATPLGTDSAAGSVQRTLEDVVAEMLRPLLEKWVAENMPRIMEKALRGEVMRSGSKPGPKV